MKSTFAKRDVAIIQSCLKNYYKLDVCRQDAGNA